MALQIGPLSEDRTFGAHVEGLTRDMLAEPEVRARLKALFEDRGLILFRGCEDSSEVQLEVSRLFGPLKEFPVGAVARAEGNPMLVDLRQEPTDMPAVEIDGKVSSEFLPWHFDHCFLGELNRGGVLRPVKICAEGGETGFLDGIDAYQRLPERLRAAIEGLDVVYHAEYEYKLRFWKPKGFKVLHISSYNMGVQEALKDTPRAIHPAVFARPSDGRKVLHLSPWWAEGIVGNETPQGNALLAEVMFAAFDEGRPYFHKWRKGDLMAWDNWRMMHMVTGHPADQERQMHRSTIVGDYGLGRLETTAAAA
jgi:taurine dioxygenase